MSEDKPITVQEKEDFRTFQDSPEFDASNLTDRQQDVMFALLEEEHEQLVIELLEGEDCPVCKSPMSKVGERVLCVAGINRSIGSRTLSNSMTRLTTLHEVYEKMLAAKKKPTIGAEHLETLIPENLIGLDMVAENKAALAHTSSRSYRERAFISQYVAIIELRKEVERVYEEEQARVELELANIEEMESDV